MRLISTLSTLYLSFYSPDQFFLRDRAGHLVLRLVRVHLGEGWGGADLKGVLVVHLRQQLFRTWISGIWMLEKRALIRTICSTAPSFFLIARISTSSGRGTKVKHRMKLFRSFPRIRNKRWEAIHVFGKLNALCCFIMMTVNLPLR